MLTVMDRAVLDETWVNNFTGRLLDIGSGSTDVARRIFPKAGAIVTVDIDPAVKPDIVHDIRYQFPVAYHNEFDLVFASHVLEHLAYRDVVPALEHLKETLLIGGVAWLIVPSLEWAAMQLLSDTPSPAVFPVLYGSSDDTEQHQIHRSGFTLAMLRREAHAAGLHVHDAYQTKFLVNMTGKKGPQSYEAVQNIVLAMRADD